MQGKYFLFKILVVLTALAVQLRINLPTYRFEFGLGPKSLSIKLARTQGRSEPGKVAATEIEPAQRRSADAGARSPGAGPAEVGPPAAGSQTAHDPRGETAGPRIEFMNIARHGTSVLAGSAEPGARVTVFENDTPVGTAVAGADGDWSLATEHRFASADPSASLRAAIAMASEPATDPAREARQRTSAAATDTASHRASGPAANLINEFEHTVAVARQANVAGQNAPAQGPAPPASTPATQLARAEAAPSGGEVSAERPSEPISIPIPMQFVYRETTLTDDGRKAVSLLLEYLKIKKYDAITLSGHADERGGEDYNMELSRRRLEAVVDLLRKGGFEGAVQILPKGKTEPYTKVDRAQFNREDLFQLDRRVELRVAR